MVFMAPNVLAELKGWARVYDADAYTRFVDRRFVETVFSAWDASSGVGLGVFFNGSGAYATWLEISQLPKLPHSPTFAPDGKPLSPIAFLELYGEPPARLPDAPLGGVLSSNPNLRERRLTQPATTGCASTATCAAG
jgi:hypothetical protein